MIFACKAAAPNAATASAKKVKSAMMATKMIMMVAPAPAQLKRALTALAVPGKNQYARPFVAME